MSHPYYYFVASLLSLEFNAKPFLSCEEFISRCREQLAPADFFVLNELLKNDVLAPSASRGILKDWAHFNHNVRSEIAWFRAMETNQDPVNYLKGGRCDDLTVIDLVARVAEAADPLTGEKLIDRARWQYLDELMQGHYFDFEVLLGYGLKLKILERYQAIESEKGKELFREYTKVNIPLN